MRSLSITRPDDWHVHFRDNDALLSTVEATSRHFSRALIMPNLSPALTSCASVLAYRQRILSAMPTSSSFIPYMTLYLNESVTTKTLQEAAKNPYLLGAKLYPAGATTHSSEGVKSIKALYPLLECMQRHNLVLQVHGEVTHGDIFERETLFIEEYLQPLIKSFPALRVVFEHISTQSAVDFVKAAPPTVAATLTPHHLLYNRNQLLAGGIKPHYYCLPILKHERDQKALQEAAISGNPKFFAGTDSAPHAKNHKESACGCAGVYSAPFALAMYAELFDKLSHLDKLEAFTSRFGAQFYELPILESQIILINEPQSIPNTLPFGREHVVPLAAGQTLQWSIREQSPID